MPGDLHNHSTCSDGSEKIEKLPLYASRIGLKYLAISDHDSVKSVQYAYEHPQQNGVTLIPATELSAVDPETGRRVHLLAYFPEIGTALKAHCAEMARRRNEACRKSIAELENIYPQFKADMVEPYAADSGVIFKSSIMRALGDLGLSDRIYGEMYHHLFSTKEPRGIVLHKPGYDTVDTVLETARKSRAVVVFAHPSEYRSMELVRRLAAEGRIDGIEVDHPRNTEQDSAECRELCARYGLIATGGTDYHGFHAAKPNPIGTCTTPDEQIERLYARAQEKRK